MSFGKESRKGVFPGIFSRLRLLGSTGKVPSGKPGQQDGGIFSGSGARPAEEQFTLLPLYDIVIFPNTMIPIFITARSGMAALEEAMRRDMRLFAACVKKTQAAGAATDETWPVGTAVRIIQHLKLPDNTMRVILSGEYRGRILETQNQEGFSLVRVSPIEAELFDDPPSSEDAALMRNVQKSFARYAELSKKIGPDTLVAVERTENPERLANLVCNSTNLKSEKKAELLALTPARQRLETILETLEKENEIIGIQKSISGKVRSRLEKNHREYYLNEQLKEINRELGKDEGEDELSDLERRIAESRPPQEVAARAAKELSRLRSLQPLSPEAAVLRVYLEWISDLPWHPAEEAPCDPAQAGRILDEDHFGMKKAKQRILEFIAVRRLLSCTGNTQNGQKIKGPILCLAGPPGTGKTSLGKSVARALGRNFVRISLGGVRDEAEIRGHRRTYVGSLPGRIIQSMRRTGASNPVILLDEIDKLSSDFRGDPANALLEVLDPQQNATFCDHYMEVPYDLSGVLFITTANSVHDIPYPLLDRMEIIEIPGYSENEKLAIAKQFLVPRELAENGFADAKVHFTDEALRSLIRSWTMESGVRGLQREIARCIRRVAIGAVESGYGDSQEKPVSAFAKNIKADGLEKILGRKTFREEPVLKEARVGVSCGLAWTESGGAMLQVESMMCAGSGEVAITGNLGDVMKESARIAVSYLRSVQDKYAMADWTAGKSDFHIHVPQGAIPKDGPSAGVAIAASLLSTLCRKAPRPGIAMTGELTLTGRILPIGGLKEKLLAAIRNGMETAILPEDNRGEWEELDRDIKDGIRVQFATGAGEAFAVLFDGEILRGKGKSVPKTARAKTAARSGTQKKV